MRDKRALATAAAFIALAFNGMTYAFMGTSLPVIQSQLGIGISLAGTLMATFQMGVTIFSLIGGILSDLFRRERIIMAGCLLLGSGALVLGAVRLFAVNMIIVWFMGSGMGCILSGSNTLLVSLYPTRKGTILNIHHVFFGLGSLAGPLIMGYLIAHGNQWRQGFIVESFVVLALGISFFFIGGKRPVARKKSLLGSQVGKLLQDKHFLVILAVCALAVGTQVAVMLMGVTFLIQAKAFSLGAAGSALSLFAVFMVLGRVICSRLTVSVKHATIILTLLWLQVATLILAWQGQGWLSVAAIALSGFTFSGIYPTSLALTGVLFPHVEGSALGILTTMGGLGTAILCWLTGYIAEITDMGRGFMIMVMACISALILFQIYHGAVCKREHASQP